jgi:DNA polymerase (family 10)
MFPQSDAYLKKLFSPETVHVTGAFRRQELVITDLEFIVLEENDTIKPKFITAQPPELVEETPDSLSYKLKNGLKLKLHTGKKNKAERLFLTSSSADFLTAFHEHFPPDSYRGNLNPDSYRDREDEAIFNDLKIPFIPACLRETAAIIDVAKRKALPDLIQPGDVKAVIHSHSNWSDGSNTIEEMANECIKRGYEYLVISDHSKTAVYARGLNEERLREQHRNIDELNKSLAPFKIFKSIESDILNDGSLDYADDILASFDLVIASVHSNLKMTEDKAMTRVLKAISNPYTTILGHPTGRLLLSRKGYPLDHKKIIDACAANDVVIELNAHPRRLDIDWQWIQYAVEKGVLISIDPDAHSLEGYNDIKYGVLAAQKGGLTKQQHLSSFSLKEFEAFLKQRRKKKGI